MAVKVASKLTLLLTDLVEHHLSLIHILSAARILCKYQDGDKSKKFVVKAGFMEGKVMDAAETNAIAKLPNREGMLSMFAGALTSTLSGLAVAMQAYADKQEEPAA